MRPEDAIGPQTALSDGFGLALHDFADVVDVASLDHARRRYMRRQAMDAVDHLIALLDALDAAGEDREPDAEGGEADDCDAEDDGTSEPSLGAPERHPSKPAFSHHFRSEDGRQLAWAAGSTLDVEEEHDGREPDCDAEEDDPGEDGGDLHDDGLSHGEGDGSDDEPSLSVIEWRGHGDNWRLSGPQTLPGQLVDVEAVDEDGDPGALPWWNRAAHPEPDARAPRAL